LVPGSAFGAGGLVGFLSPPIYAVPGSAFGAQILGAARRGGDQHRRAAGIEDIAPLTGATPGA
jgi:hypothetical protein